MTSNGEDLVFAGASRVGRGTPWGTLCEVVAQAMETRGYSIAIETRSFGPNNGRYVADGRAVLGAWNMMWLHDCYHGLREYAAEGPRSNLRLVANINAPAWSVIAVNAASGITDLRHVTAERRPARVFVGAGPVYQQILDYYGWTAELLESWGGSLRSVHEEPAYDPDDPPIDEPEFRPWARSGEFDVIIDSLYVGYLPENHHWVEASILWDLRFLPVPDAVIDRVAEAGLGHRGWVPRRILRGAWTDVPAIARLPDVVYSSAEAPDAFAYDVAAALDASRAAFRQCHLPFSYDPDNVAEDFIAAAEMYAVPRWKILLTEVFPNITGPLMVELGLRMTYSIAYIAALSFLGLGMQPPTADWGLMINENRIALLVQPWGVILPVIAIAVLTVGTNLITDSLARASATLNVGDE